MCALLELAEVELLEIDIYDEGPLPEGYDDEHYVPPTVFYTIVSFGTHSISTYLMDMLREGAFGFVLASQGDPVGIGVVGHAQSSM